MLIYGYDDQILIVISELSMEVRGVRVDKSQRSEVGLPLNYKS